MTSNTILRKQSGAALLAFMLIVIAGTSFLLVTKLNANLVIVEGDLQTRLALNLAKEALIGYAATYPDNVNSSEGPGYLPCPDSDKDGDAEGNCSDTGSIRTIGRLPYKTLELTDIRDGSGQELWYALSENFRYGSSKIVPLNNESPESAQLTVNGTEDIVAVIIAPGEPVNLPDATPQSRDPNENVIVNEIQNYLEDDNNNLDTAFVTSSNDDFNDVVAVITREELMRAVEKRVLGEVKTMLASYNVTYGAYPLLTPFADPKAEFRNLTGTHNGSNNSASLADTTANFIEWDIQTGDIVINVTDGSLGTVTGVSANTLTLGGLSWGMENDFDINVVSDAEDNDRYVVYKKNWNTNLLSGTATGGSSSLTLNDTSKDFDETGVSAGDIIDNITDGSSGMVEEVVSSTQLTVKSLSGGTNNVFTTGDSYVIRSNVSRATGANNSTSLVDANKDFIEMGIQAGDLVVNLTDGSSGMVSTVATNTLTLNSLNFGTDNDFDTNDYYYIPRYNTDSSTREGLLAFHEEGKLFPTAFDVDFNITAASGDVSFDTTEFPGTQATYQTALVTFLTSYASIPLTDTIDLTEGVCSWFSSDIADCYFYYPPENINISGTITLGSNTPVITDSNADFVTDGVKRGDIVQNFDDEYPLSPPVSGTADKGGATGVATGGSNNLLLEDTSKNFINLGVLTGDTIINTTDGSNGTIASVSTGDITVTSLTGGTNNVFNPGDNYNISGNSVLYDASADFNAAGIVAYQYLVYNDTTGVRAVITEVVDDNTIKAVELDNQTSPIIFTSGNNYTVYTPGIVVVTDVPSSTVANTTRSSVYNPDFDLLAGPYEEYYRILTAADSFNSNATTASGNTLTDTSKNFIDEGVISGDIIENVTDASSFGEITNVTANTITATLYGGTLNTFTTSDSYIIYHNYVYSRRAEWHTRFSDNMVTKSLSNKRVRDVCLGYDPNCGATSTTAFSGNGGVPLITIRDYAKDGVTEVGRATFIPSALSSGSLRVADIDYYLAESSGDIPEWFLKNKWHQLVYVAYSAGDIPGAAAACIAGTDCLTLTGTGSPDDDKQAVVIISGEEIDTQDRTAADLDDYFEMENASQGDDIFQHAVNSTTYNDQDKIIE